MNHRHGLSKHPVYRIWQAMKGRCYNPRDQKFSRYGARGIRVCSAWLRVEAFFNWAVSNGYSRGLWLDRIDNDGHYQPSNCRFATPTLSNRNRNYCKLTRESAQRIRELFASGLRQSDISEMFGLKGTHVFKVVHQVIWKT